MPALLREVLIILLLVVCNGFFAMAEIAIVSSRKHRLRQLAAEGRRRARAALALAEEPALFLSSVQVGITLIGILAGAFGGATLAGELGNRLAAVPRLAAYGHSLAFFLVVFAITYCSLVIGELAPKRIALSNPEGLAMLVARPMQLLMRLMLPIARVVNASAELLIRLLRLRPPDEPRTSDEEVRWLLEEGVMAGIFERAEAQIIDRLFRLSDRRIAALMTPRTEVVCLPLDASPAEIGRLLTTAAHYAYPVCREDLDHVVGVVTSQEVLAHALTGEPFDLDALARAPLVLPESFRALPAVERLREHGTHLAVIIDEFGATAGVVTLTDIIESLIGEIPSPAEEPAVVRRSDGTLLVDGGLAIDAVKELLDVPRLPDEALGYLTLAGLLLTALGRVPTVGDDYTWGGYRFEIVDMDGNRIDRVLISPVPEAAA